MKGHVYDCKNLGQAEQYNLTTKKLANYVGRVFKQGTDVKIAVEHLTIPIVIMPLDIDELNCTKTEKCIWEKQVDQYVKRLDQLEENIRTLYSLIWGQCSEVMQAKLEAMPEYAVASNDNDGVELLKLVKTISFNFQSQKYLHQAVHEAKRRFYTQYQGKTATAQEYLEQFKNHVDVLKHVGAVIGPDTSIVNQIAKEDPSHTVGSPITTVHQTKAMAEYLAVAFMLGADRIRYSIW